MRKPYWLKRKMPDIKVAAETKQIIRDYGLYTVCESAQCPNKGECYNEHTATFIALGDICTRRCTFCAVSKEIESIKPPDKDEPEKIAAAASKLNLDYLVVTMVTRDDLPDGGANHIASIIRTVRKNCKPELLIELLTSDFNGDEQQIAVISRAQPDVFNHNMETISRLYQYLRPQADYQRSLNVLSLMKNINSGILTKSGFMVGLGETENDVDMLMDDLRKQKVDILTIGQYLAPTANHYPVKEYVHPDIFSKYQEMALGKGFLECIAGPYIRSSYRARYAERWLKTNSYASQHHLIKAGDSLLSKHNNLQHKQGVIMLITITARHFDLTNAIRDFIEQSCDKLSRYFDHIISIHVTLTLENMRNHVEMNLHASKFNLQSESEEMDMYIAVETAIEKMETQLKKLKDKVTDHQKKSIRKNPDFFYANTFERISEPARKRMIKTKRIQAETMSVSDAIDVLDRKSSPYMIFKNLETDRVNVLVKKGDLFKLIEP